MSAAPVPASVTLRHERGRKFNCARGKRTRSRWDGSPATGRPLPPSLLPPSSPRRHSVASPRHSVANPPVTSSARMTPPENTRAPRLVTSAIELTAALVTTRRVHPRRASRQLRHQPRAQLPARQNQRARPMAGLFVNYVATHTRTMSRLLKRGEWGFDSPTEPPRRGLASSVAPRTAQRGPTLGGSNTVPPSMKWPGMTRLRAGHSRPIQTRRMGDSNPRGLAPNTLSKRAP
jgi:hypothetical protein